jgi:hypothetical protein
MARLLETGAILERESRLVTSLFSKGSGFLIGESRRASVLSRENEGNTTAFEQSRWGGGRYA